MQYYTFDMDEQSRNSCTIATPFGLFCYCQLPMGVRKAPDIATEIMHNIFSDMDNVEFYMDDISCFSNSWEEHLGLLEEVLCHLDSIGFTINSLKCEWAVSETNFLGHWLTPTGIKAWKKKINIVHEATQEYQIIMCFLRHGKLLLQYVAMTNPHTCAPNSHDQKSTFSMDSCTPKSV